MIKAILNGLISFIIALVRVILLPIDLLITQYLPTLDNAFSAISNFFDYIGQFIGWAIDALGFPSWLIDFIISYYVFKLTVPLLISAVKNAIKWYNALKF